MRSDPTLIDVLEQVRAAVRAQTGRLVGLHVTVPPGLTPAEAERLLATALGADAKVDVRAEPRTGPVRVLSMEFVR